MSTKYHIVQRYPRTIIDAFGCDADSARAVFGPYRHTERLVMRCIYALAAIVAAGVYFGVL